MYIVHAEGRKDLLRRKPWREIRCRPLKYQRLDTSICRSGGIQPIIETVLPLTTYIVCTLYIVHTEGRKGLLRRKSRREIRCRPLKYQKLDTSIWRSGEVQPIMETVLPLTTYIVCTVIIQRVERISFVGNLGEESVVVRWNIKGWTQVFENRGNLLQCTPSITVMYSLLYSSAT